MSVTGVVNPRDMWYGAFERLYEGGGVEKSAARLAEERLREELKGYGDAKQLEAYWKTPEASEAAQRVTVATAKEFPQLKGKKLNPNTVLDAACGGRAVELTINKLELAQGVIGLATQKEFKANLKA